MCTFLFGNGLTQVFDHLPRTSRTFCPKLQYFLSFSANLNVIYPAISYRRVPKKKEATNVLRYGHVGEMANGARSTCLPSLACFAGRVCLQTVWACVCTRVCVHTSCNCARAYVYRSCSTRSCTVNIARATNFVSYPVRLSCRCHCHDSSFSYRYIRSLCLASAHRRDRFVIFPSICDLWIGND